MTYNYITAVILTYNEEIIISKCIEALNFVNEIIILDSFSTDSTIDIASKYNVKIFQHDFDNYANQRNRLLNLVSSSSKWVLMVDADEVVSKELKNEILQVINHPNNNISLYNVRRKDIYNEKWLKYSSGYPTWFGRLFRNGDVWVEREINEEFHTKGKIGFLNEHLIHYPYNKGISWWLHKHNLYSTMEAKFFNDNNDNIIHFKDLTSPSPIIRRKVFKKIFYLLPFRPFIVFIFLYFFKLGFLDGYLGYRICRLRSFYEMLINIKKEEFKLKC
jgi:glycosyltransferase involved in cell wall biosynthesis